MNRKQVLTKLQAYAGFLVLSSAVNGSAQDVPAGILSLSPVQANSCISVTLTVPKGETLLGLRWYNNDAVNAPTQILLYESVSFEKPDVARISLVQELLVSESSSWVDSRFDQPIISASGYLQCIFQLPAFVERSGVGTNGGPGIGFVLASGLTSLPVFFSTDGQDWMRLHKSYNLMVEPILATGLHRQAAISLESLESARLEGWWTEVHSEGDSRIDEIQEEGIYSPVARISSISPNPFNPQLSFTVDSPAAQLLIVEILNARGQRIAVIHNAWLPTGEHSFTWDGLDSAGMGVSSGVYLIHVKDTRGTVTTQKAVLVR